MSKKINTNWMTKIAATENAVASFNAISDITVNTVALRNARIEREQYAAAHAARAAAQTRRTVKQLVLTALGSAAVTTMIVAYVVSVL